MRDRRRHRTGITAAAASFVVAVGAVVTSGLALAHPVEPSQHTVRVVPSPPPTATRQLPEVAAGGAKLSVARRQVVRGLGRRDRCERICERNRAQRCRPLRHGVTYETLKCSRPARYQRWWKCKTATGRLITQRSQVRILSPLPGKTTPGGNSGSRFRWVCERQGCLRFFPSVCASSRTRASQHHVLTQRNGFLARPLGDWGLLREPGCPLRAVALRSASVNLPSASRCASSTSAPAASISRRYGGHPQGRQGTDVDR